MKKYSVFILLCFCMTLPAFAQLKTDNFTSDDRKVLTDLQVKTGKLEVKLDEYQQQMNLQFGHVQKQFDSLQKQFDSVQRQFDNVDKRFDNLQTFLYWGFGILISFMGFLLGFVLWDRRTTLAPVTRETEELKRQENKILDVLRDYSEKVPELRQLLKNSGIL
ncbi:hypothetical protein H8E88_03485 [candidate division KSB1 bacterium]|nr:hypothetical protein [candidate division KSB1 bacterium]